MGSADHKRRQNIENKEDRGRKLVASVIYFSFLTHVARFEENSWTGFVLYTQSGWRRAEGVQGAWRRSRQRARKRTGEGAAAEREGAPQATGWRPAETEGAPGWRKLGQEAGGGGEERKRACCGEEKGWKRWRLRSLWEAGEACQRQQEGGE